MSRSKCARELFGPPPGSNEPINGVQKAIFRGGLTVAGLSLGGPLGAVVGGLIANAMIDSDSK